VKDLAWWCTPVIPAIREVKIEGARSKTTKAKPETPSGRITGKRPRGMAQVVEHSIPVLTKELTKTAMTTKNQQCGGTHPQSQHWRLSQDLGMCASQKSAKTVLSVTAPAGFLMIQLPKENCMSGSELGHLIVLVIFCLF
jgi:hypothetical protein